MDQRPPKLLSVGARAGRAVGGAQTSSRSGRRTGRGARGRGARTELLSVGARTLLSVGGRKLLSVGARKLLSVGGRANIRFTVNLVVDYEVSAAPPP